MLTTDQKGAIAETAIAHEATKLGCKWGPRLGDAIVVRCYSSRRTAQGLSRRVYTAQEIDAFAVYCPDVDRCYWIPFGVIAASSEMRLR